MKVRYILTMENLVVHGKRIDNLRIDWQDNATLEEVMEFSHKWLMTQNFLTSHMNGLSEVGESSITIEPVEENVFD